MEIGGSRFIGYNIFITKLEKITDPGLRKKPDRSKRKKIDSKRRGKIYGSN